MAPFLRLAAFVASACAYDIRRVAPATNLTLPTEVLPAAQFSVPLVEKVPRTTFKKNLLKALRGGRLATLAGSANDAEYVTDITISGQTFKIVVDTGSSDTWLAQKGFKCFNLTSHPEPPSHCGFGTSGFDQSKSKTFTSYPNKNFNISYLDGEFLTGVVGFDTVTVGGMKVTKQEIGLVNNAAWDGDGVSTGLMGLSYPPLTNVYNGTDPNKDVRGQADTYSPFFFTAVSEKVVSSPYFSVALNRGSFKQEESSKYDPNLGYLAFGGIAPVKTTHTAVTVPVQGYAVKSEPINEYIFYSVNIDSYIFDGSTALTGSGKQAVLDTGTTLNYIPDALAKAYNSKFVPPATYNADQDLYYVSCNATAPPFTVQIGGAKFSINPKDNIVPSGKDSDGNDLCTSGTQNGGDPSDPRKFYIMGDVLLHNVVATFNIQSNRITVTQRAAY